MTSFITHNRNSTITFAVMLQSCGFLNHELQVTSYDIKNHELRVKIHELQHQKHEL